MEIEAKETFDIPDGVYKGVITGVEYRTEPYQYTDIYIVPEGFEGKMDKGLKYGCPTTISENSKLGKLLGQFVKIVPKQKYDPQEILVTKKVRINVSNEETKNGRFARILTVKKLDDEAPASSNGLNMELIG